jgi:hypothetical protein
MEAKKIIAKRSLILLVGLFISTITWAQTQNVLGLKAKTANLLGLELFYFGNGDAANNLPDKQYMFGVFSFKEMGELGLMEINNFVSEKIRFDENKLFLSSLGSDERSVDINLLSPYKQETGEYGNALVALDEDISLNIEFSIEVTPDMNVLLITYSFHERLIDTEDNNLVAEKVNDKIEKVNDKYIDDKDKKVDDKYIDEKIYTVTESENVDTTKKQGIYVAVLRYSLR